MSENENTKNGNSAEPEVESGAERAARFAQIASEVVDDFSTFLDHLPLERFAALLVNLKPRAAEILNQMDDYAKHGHARDMEAINRALERRWAIVTAVSNAMKDMGLSEDAALLLLNPPPEDEGDALSLSSLAAGMLEQIRDNPSAAMQLLHSLMNMGHPAPGEFVEPGDRFFVEIQAIQAQSEYGRALRDGGSTREIMNRLDYLAAKLAEEPTVAADPDPEPGA